MEHKIYFYYVIALLMLQSFSYTQVDNLDYISNQKFGIKFKIPHGWKHQQDESWIILNHPKISGTILIIPTGANSIEEVRQQMLEGLEEEGTLLSLSGKLSILGNDIIAGEYAGFYEYQIVKAYVIGTHSKQGSGIYILAFDSPKSFTKELAKTAEIIAKGIQYMNTKTSEKVPGERGTVYNDASGLMKYFAGTYYSFTGGGITSGGTERRFVICSNGQFYFTSESGYSGDAGADGAWGIASQSGDAGTWDINGNKTSGQILLRYNNGNTETVNYQVCGDGCIYFGNVKYAYEKPSICE